MPAISVSPKLYGQPTYELWLTDDNGTRITDANGRTYLKGFFKLRAGRVANEIASFSLELPGDFPDSLSDPSKDRMVQVWRAPVGGRLKFWRAYFLRLRDFDNQGGRETVTIGGPDQNDLLRRRIVAAYSGSAQANKTDFADDMMKEVVTESIADGVAPTPDAGTRVWSDLSIAADLGLGPSISKDFSFDRLLTESGQGVLPQLAKAARIAGTEVFFDVVPDVIGENTISFRFETYIGQPGQDVSDRVIFEEARGNLENAQFREDWTGEFNYVYGAGQGKEADRNIQQEYDSGRYSASKWARIEAFADARNQSTDNGVREAARDKLEDGRPKIRITGTPRDTEGTRFGIHWDWGYKVSAKKRNIQFDNIIRSVVLEVDERGNETRNTRLEYES